VINGNKFDMSEAPVFRKVATVRAVKMTEPFNVKTISGNVALGIAGDYLCEGTSPEDRWPVAHEVFEAGHVRSVDADEVSRSLRQMLHGLSVEVSGSVYDDVKRRVFEGLALIQELQDKVLLQDVATAVEGGPQLGDLGSVGEVPPASPPMW
jgi:hypothetical protein